MNENELFLDYLKNGNEKSLKELMLMINKWLPNVIFRILNDNEATKDVIQKTWLKIVEIKSRFNEKKGKINNLIYKIAVNYAYKEKKRLIKKNMNINDINIDMPDPDPSEFYERDENFRLLNEAMGKLKESCREVIELFYFEDMPYSKISELLETTENTVKMRLHHCKKYLGQLLGSMGL